MKNINNRIKNPARTVLWFAIPCSIFVILSAITVVITGDSFTPREIIVALIAVIGLWLQYFVLKYGKRRNKGDDS